jgi:CHAT domain-containing protein
VGDRLFASALNVQAFQDLILRSNATTTNDVNLRANGNLIAQSLTTNGGDATLTSRRQDISTNTINTSSNRDGGAIALRADRGSIQTGDLDSSGGRNSGDVALTSRAALDLADVTINAQSNTGDSGDVTLRSDRGNINIGNINTSSNARAGGDIGLFAPLSNRMIVSGNLTASGRQQGGNISVITGQQITTGEIDSSSAVGNGGNVTLDPSGDVESVFINAQGGRRGIGGDVIVTSIDESVRLTGTFTDREGLQASISTAGGVAGGDITITHTTEDPLVPFIVGDLSETGNGSTGVITTGDGNIIDTTRAFPDPYTQLNIQIITDDSGTAGLVPENNPEGNEDPDSSEDPYLLDEYFTRQIEQYMGWEPGVEIKSLEEIQRELRDVEEAIGVKPAIIYAVFDPPSRRYQVDENGNFLRDEDGNLIEDLNNQGVLLRNENQDNDVLKLVLVTSDHEPILAVSDPSPIRSEVEAERNQFRYFLEHQSLASDNTNYLEYAQLFYHWLIKPLKQDLEDLQVENLVFIMDYPLRFVPLSAIHNGNHFLIEDYSIGLMPSMSLTDTRYINISDQKVDALAMGSIDFPGAGLDSLPAAVEEVQMTQYDWGGEQAIGSEFTVENLVHTNNSNGSFGVIHLATHGSFDQSQALSYIQFYDQQLTLDQAPSLHLSLNRPATELFVLSACETALGSEEAELGFAGFAHQLGVKSVVASLWQINDAGTLALMQSFYQTLSQGNTFKADALREAQLALQSGQVHIENGAIVDAQGNILPLPDGYENLSQNLSHPYYWSAFTVVGTPW